MRHRVLLPYLDTRDFTSPEKLRSLIRGRLILFYTSDHPHLNLMTDSARPSAFLGLHTLTDNKTSSYVFKRTKLSNKNNYRVRNEAGPKRRLNLGWKRKVTLHEITSLIHECQIWVESCFGPREGRDTEGRWSRYWTLQWIRSSSQRSTHPIPASHGRRITRTLLINSITNSSSSSWGRNMIRPTCGHEPN